MLRNLIATARSACPAIVADEVQSFVYSMDVTQRDDWRQLEVIINQVQNDFSKRLRKDYPMLTEHDIHSILLIRAHISNSKIARIMNIEPTSFRIARYRLKKKMRVETDSFSDFIRKLYT